MASYDYQPLFAEELDRANAAEIQLRRAREAFFGIAELAREELTIGSIGTSQEVSLRSILRKALASLDEIDHPKTQI